MISSLWLPYLSGSLEISLAFIFLGKLLEKQQKIFILLPIMLPICWLFSQSMLVSLKVLLLVTVLFLCTCHSSVNGFPLSATAWLL